MIVDHRTYKLPHATTDEYLERYERYGWPLQVRYLGHPLGCFVSDIGPLNEVVHLWAYESMADREERRARLAEDPDWVEFRRQNAGSFVSQEIKILRPASFSVLAPPFDPGALPKVER